MKSSDEATTITPASPLEELAVNLRKTGLSIANIMKETGLPERLVKSFISDTPKPGKAKKQVSKPPRRSIRAQDRVFSLASRDIGIRDYQVGEILYQEYGTTWNTSTGEYESNSTSDIRKHLKARVRQRAKDEGCNVIFVMDWVDEASPRASSEFLYNAAIELSDRIHECVTEYMGYHTTRWGEDNEEARAAQRKQRYAVVNHLLKLTVNGYGDEPLKRLVSRVEVLINELEGTIDAPLSTTGSAQGSGKEDELPDYYPEPSRADAFLDFVEFQGWIRKAPRRLA